MIKIDKNELIHINVVIGWRMFIAYLRLNQATRKYQFSLPYIIKCCLD